MADEKDNRTFYIALKLTYGRSNRRKDAIKDSFEAI